MNFSINLMEAKLGFKKFSVYCCIKIKYHPLLLHLFNCNGSLHINLLKAKIKVSALIFTPFIIINIFSMCNGSDGKGGESGLKGIGSNPSWGKKIEKYVIFFLVGYFGTYEIYL